MEVVFHGWIEEDDSMKIRAKYAEFVGYVTFNGERFNEWRCPDEDCGMHVIEEYSFFPYCGRKLKFREQTMSDEFRDFLKEI